VAVSGRDIAVRAFSTPEWRSAAEALFQATGVTVSAVDFEQGDVHSGGARCSFCHFASEISEFSPSTCFMTSLSPQSGVGRIVCRSGAAALFAPVLRNDQAVAHIVITGFVTSTRERRGLYEQMITRGVKEDSARRAVKALPVISRRQAESYLQIAVASARTVFEATLERLSSRERIEELKLFVSAGRQVVATERLDAENLGTIAEEAVAIVGGEAGAILRPRGSVLEVVAHTSGWRGALGALIPRAATASGRALETGKTVVSPAREGSSSTLAMPLSISGRTLAVLEVRLPPDSMPLAPDRVSRLGRFGQFVAIALEREDERTAVSRAMAGYTQLNALASELGAQTDVDHVITLSIDAIKRAFDFDLAGLVLTGWGRDNAEVLVAGEVAHADLDQVLEIVSGRDVTLHPFKVLRTHAHTGSLSSGATPAEDWALTVTSLTYGDLDVGWLFLGRADGDRYGAQDNALLEGIAAHTGAAFGRAALFSRIREDYAKTIAALSVSLDIGERSSTGHATRVMDYAMMIGSELGLDYEEVEQLRFAGLLHDIGKTGVATDILLKPSGLTPSEVAEIQRHAEIGADIVEQIEFLRAITPIILHHHERWDGKGYPHGLMGDAIPLLARILAVADSFDAMTTEHAHRKRLSFSAARRELEAGTGTQYDPRVVAAMFEILDRMAIAGGTGLLAPIEVRGRPDLPS
jgi:putative nucleotidyltransferase with HDIG domain